MLQHTSLILSNGLSSHSMLCGNYPLRGFIDPSPKQKPSITKTIKGMQTPTPTQQRSQAFASVVKTMAPTISRSPSLVADDEKEKLLVIMGATGSGKSRLSVDLATVFEGEIINSDKLQFYNGLPITTNQMSVPDRRGIPHHLIGDLHPKGRELSASEFRSEADGAISSILSRGKLPILASGSNSFVHALLAESWDPRTNPFNGTGPVCLNLKYDCCFIWIDVSQPVLFESHSKRVDEMLKAGMFKELADFYDSGESDTRVGLWKAIGVPEFEDYFKTYSTRETTNMEKWDKARKTAYEKAVREIKKNTFRLAKNQIRKIKQLRSAGWDIKRIDATYASMVAMSPMGKEDGGCDGDGRRRGRWREIWEKQVLEPCVQIVRNEMSSFAARAK